VACALNYDAVVSKLLSLGAQTTVQDNKGLSPVMTACSYGHLQALDALASVGVSGNCEFVNFLLVIFLFDDLYQYKSHVDEL